MGCTLTKDARVSEKEVRLKEGEEPLLMRLGHAEHLPSLDVGSESDVFVVMDLLDAHGHGRPQPARALLQVRPV